MGRNWIRQFGVTVGQVHNLGHSSLLKEVLQKHTAAFTDELGCLKGPKVKLHVNANAKPKFHRPRNVPMVLKKKVEDELDRLQKLGIISPVKHSEWAAPIVPVLKRNGSLRICGDYNVTGPSSYCVELQLGHTVRRHVDCLRRRDIPQPSPSVSPAPPMSDPILFPDVPDTVPPIPPVADPPEDEALPVLPAQEQHVIPPPSPLRTVPPPPQEQTVPPPPPRIRHSERLRIPPDYLSHSHQ